MRVNAFAVAVGLGFIALTGSRGPMLAIGGAHVLLLAMVRPRLLAIAVVAVLVVVGLVELLVPSVEASVWHAFANRSASERLIIWRLSLKVIATSPWVGLGPTARPGRVNEGFPHNLLLSTVFYAGLVGFAMFLSLLALVGRTAWRRPRGVGRLMRIALLAYPILAGMTDMSILIKGPAPMWYMVWLPLIVCMGTDRIAGVGRPSPPTAQGRRCDGRSGYVANG
ncbi:O-antigen ligase [Acidisphaera sp. S103]|uniref:O-antigen ligase family protein n=1 Tax=Acidisphaera sp. S103 TaxID=1747223 RepID=UPI00131E17CD|nr:O-antigen ligase family protein [Acidisphaera sp. S103]